jgi:molecular chaperone GrpE
MGASSMGGGREPRFDVPRRQERGEPEHDEDMRDEPVRRAAPSPDEMPASAPATPAQAPVGDTAELEKVRAEAADYKDKALRATAELENYRRRAEKERDDVSKYAISSFAREMLPVADNLRRALDAQPPLEGEAAAVLKAFVSGVELTERELLSAFERFGLKKIDPLGQPFDHNIHQAMFEIEDPSKPAGIVVQVMQSGYLLKDRLLRPALVAVSKGGATRATEEGAGQTPGQTQGAAQGAHGSYASSAGGEGHRVDTKA